MHRIISTAVAVGLAITITAAGLDARPALAQEATPDPSVVATEPTPRPRFDATPGAFPLCIDEPPFDQRVSPTGPTMGTWQTSAPRSQQRVPRPGDTVELSLRDKFGDGSRIVRADVYRPDGQHHRFTRWLPASTWATVAYPSDTIDVAVPSPSPNFVSPPPLVNGSYTVIWTDFATGGYIACDGFVVI